MAIEYIKGDLFTTKCKYIAHGCNSQGVMGPGVAKLIKEKVTLNKVNFNYKWNGLGSIYIPTNTEELAFLGTLLYQISIDTGTSLVVSGYPINDWLLDIGKLGEKKVIDNEYKKLADLENKLKSLLSEDAKTANELDEISNLLK
jgi:hypothetical protein